MVAQNGLHPHKGFDTTIAAAPLTFEEKVDYLREAWGYEHPHQVIENLVDSAWRNVESSKMQPTKQPGNLPSAGSSQTITQGTGKCPA